MFNLRKLLVLILCTFVLIGCAPRKTANHPSPEKPKTINVSYVSRPINLPSIVAQERKMYEAEFALDGIEFKWHDISAPSNQLEALAARSLDFANSLNYVSVVLAKSKGNDLKIISSYSRFPKGISLVTLANGPIDSISDLKGKKIALQKGTMLHEMLIRALSEANLTIQDIELVDMASPAAAAAITSGQVDATILPEPLLSKSVATGNIRKLRTAEGLIPGLTVIAVRNEFAATQPEIIKRYLNVHKASIEWSEANLETSFAMAAKQNGMGINEVKALYPEFSFEMGLKDVKSDLLKSADFLQKEGMLRPDLDLAQLVADLIDSSYLPEQ